MLDTPGEDTGLSVGADLVLREDKGLTIGSRVQGEGGSAHWWACLHGTQFS